MLRALSKIRFCLMLSVLAIGLTHCGQNQLSGFIPAQFSVTPKCGETDKVFKFRNTFEEALAIEGAALSGGTNGGANYSLQGLTIGTNEETPPQASGGIGPASVPPGQSYSLRVRYNPREETIEAPHVSIVDLVYSAPKSGVIQIELTGVSVGEENCPEVVTDGGESGLDGAVALTVTKMVAVTGAVAEPISSDNGIRPFDVFEVEGTVLDATAGTVFFPAIAESDSFVLPRPNASSPQLHGIIQSDTFIINRNDVSGTFDQGSGAVTLSGLEIDLHIVDPDTMLEITVDLTTMTAPLATLPVDTLINGGFIIDGDQMRGEPINQETGSIILVGVADVNDATTNSAGGLELLVAKGNKMGVLIEATVQCPNGTTNCAAP